MNEKPITAFHNYPTAALFCLTSAFWLMIATFMGILLATLLIAPDLTEGIGWLTFGRIRPVHVNLVLFGFVTPGLLSAAFYYIPKLLRTDLYSEKLGIISACAWNLAMVATVVTLLAGHTQAREFAGYAGNFMFCAGHNELFFNRCVSTGTDSFRIHMVCVRGRGSDGTDLCPGKCHLAT